ncbi:MAG: chemotaxis response regulator protein-glutamate methylesterase [bacterium]
MNGPINVVVIDDSAFMRKSLTLMLESDPQIRVVGTARDGRDGVDKVRKLNPDVVTLDVEMPGLDGLAALKIIMREMPVPVLMVSSLTSEGAEATLEALNLGAVDFISKDLSYVSVDILKIKEELIAKVKEIATSRYARLRYQALGSSRHAVRDTEEISQSRVRIPSILQENLEAVVLGVSTGGPLALLQIIPKLPADFPIGIAIVQHMPPHFTRTLSERLNSLSKVAVKEAEHGELMEPGKVLIAPGGKHLLFSRGHGAMQVIISEEPRTTIFRPSVDVMMRSAVEAAHGPLLGVIMTGMGKDGLDSLRLIKRKGGYIIAQDEESCVVYGMPRAAVEDGIADTVVPLMEIPDALIRLANIRTAPVSSKVIAG